jgi:hypothetical protein
MKILIPVPVAKRLPNIKEGELFSPSVIITFYKASLGMEYQVKAFAYCDPYKDWYDATPDEKYIFSRIGGNIVLEWYEEVEVDSLFPDDNKAYAVAEAASNGKFDRTTFHQEGQTYLKNYFLKALNK